MGEMLHILGASLVWLVAARGALIQYTTEKELMLSPAYPADLLLWSSWFVHMGNVSLVSTWKVRNTNAASHPCTSFVGSRNYDPYGAHDER